MRRPGFTGAGLDRADHLRLDPAALAEAAAHPDARLLAMAGLDPIVDEGGRLRWTKLGGLEAEELIFLGFDGGAPRFARLLRDAALGERAWRIFRVLGEMEGRDAAIWGAARSLNEWHGRHRFCANCGQATRPFRAGWGRTCSQCSAEHFPRVDPVVIMLAEHGGRVLLGRQAQYPSGRYSALAGFVEPGESIEEAVARELMEEAGVEASSVRYVASQPWPFPGSLMIGCVAPVVSDALTIDRNELESAIWVSREEVAAALAGRAGAPFEAPPHFAIAHTLLVSWLEEHSENRR
jgi:NAD+ diphosphatase